MITFIRGVTATWRSLFRKPGFALAVILTLTLGIGANTATLSLLYGYLLAPLPYPNAGQLVRLPLTSKSQNGDGSISSPLYYDLQSQNTALADSAKYKFQNFNLTTTGQPIHLRGIETTASLFSTLGIHPLLGQVFTPAANQPGAAGQLVMSYRLWSQLFNRNPAVLGQTLRVDNHAYTVIGVMPARFQFPDAQTDMWVPAEITADDRNPVNLDNVQWQMIGRLKTGATPKQFDAQSETIVANAIEHFPVAAAIPYFKGLGLTVKATPLRTAMVGVLSQRLLLVQLATGLLLLLVWFNLANLFIARALNRHGELVLRRVLGADTRTLFRQLFTESLALCVLGAIAGLVLGEVLLRVLLSTGFGTSELAFPIGEWGITVGIAAVLAVFSALVFALAGLYFVRRQDLGQALREGDARSSGGRGEHRIRAGLVVTQLVLACILTGVGAMLAHSLMQLGDVKLGFQPEHVVTFQVFLPSRGDPVKSGPGKAIALARLQARLARVPSLHAVTITDQVPFDGQAVPYTAFPSPFGGSRTPDVFAVVADPGYFQTFDIPLLAGRGFLPQDANAQLADAVIDVKAAMDLFGTTNAIGREFNFNRPDYNIHNSLFRIIGVVSNSHRSKLDQSEQSGSVYIDREQVLPVKNPDMSWAFDNWYVAMRTNLSTAAIVPVLSRAVAQALPGVPIYDVRSMDERLASHLAPRRGLMTLVLMFALGALILAAVGLYAVQSYAVSQRLREFGIRAALGADRGKLLALVLREIAKLLVIGLVLGLIGVVLFGHVFASALFDVNMADPVSLFLVFVILSFTALVAGWIPAWRASRVPPMQALRE